MKFKKLIGKIAKLCLIVTSPMWPLWIAAPTELIETLYPNVKTTQEAHKILEQEKKKLGMTDQVRLRIYEKDELRELYINGYSGKKHDGSGFIIASNMSDLDRILIRHELYHIHKDKVGHAFETKQADLDYKKSSKRSLGYVSKYFYMLEPRANIYSVTGIRL